MNICENIANSEVVEYAEPNMVITASIDQVIPRDFLYPQQWHIPFTGLPNAWQILRNNNPTGVMPGRPGDLTFGSENIIIAIMDTGIQSRTVGSEITAAHPEFNGQVINGETKVYRFFDFRNMVHNNNPYQNNDHGMGAAGVASALANNPSSDAMNQFEGIAGAAPNCKVMGLIAPFGKTLLNWADSYIWTAGFDRVEN